MHIHFKTCFKNPTYLINLISGDAIFSTHFLYFAHTWLSSVSPFEYVLLCFIISSYHFRTLVWGIYLVSFPHVFLQIGWEGSYQGIFLIMVFRFYLSSFFPKNIQYLLRVYLWCRFSSESSSPSWICTQSFPLSVFNFPLLSAAVMLQWQMLKKTKQNPGKRACSHAYLHLFTTVYLCWPYINYINSFAPNCVLRSKFLKLVLKSI